MRPDGGTAKELPARNNRCLAALVGRLAPERSAPPGRAAPPSPDPAPGAASVAVPPPRPLEPVPPAPLAPDTAIPATPAPDALPPKPPEAMALPAPPLDVRFPYPFSVMNPAEVPEEIWQRARAAKGST